MTRKILLITLGFSLVVGGFWAGQAQDPSDVRKDPPTVAAPATQTDLSGTYAGTFNCDALGLTGDTTMTVNGHEFTLADGRTGRIVGSTTGGYTAVALMLTPTATGTAGAAATTTAPTVVSMRARKSGNRLTLTSVGNPAMKCSFTPSRVARGRRTPRTPAATGTEVSAPATVPPSAVPTESPVPSQSPTPTPMPSPTPEPTPVPSPSPEPTPVPTPVPTPGEPTPSPTPSPTASPTPTPTPTPTPRPAN